MAIIQARDGRAAVGHMGPMAGGLAFERAENWEELEADAATAILASGHSARHDGVHPCPAELAGRARRHRHDRPSAEEGEGRGTRPGTS